MADQNSVLPKRALVCFAMVLTAIGLWHTISTVKPSVYLDIPQSPNVSSESPTAADNISSAKLVTMSPAKVLSQKVSEISESLQNQSVSQRHFRITAQYQDQRKNSQVGKIILSHPAQQKNPEVGNFTRPHQALRTNPKVRKVVRPHHPQRKKPQNRKLTPPQRARPKNLQAENITLPQQARLINPQVGKSRPPQLAQRKNPQDRKLTRFQKARLKHPRLGKFIPPSKAKHPKPPKARPGKPRAEDEAPLRPEDIRPPKNKLAWCYESIQDNKSSEAINGSQSNPSEIRQVVFAKIHKAASSTVQNILLRFTMARNLSSLLPKRGPIISQISSVIKRSKVIPHTEGDRFYDTLCSHVLYNRSQINQYFSKKAVRIAIIREPMKQVLSALAYYTLRYPDPTLKEGYLKHEDNPINGFLKHPEDFAKGKKCPNPHSFVNTKMSYDLGLKVSNIDGTKQNRAKIQAFLDKLEKEFDLVLISDFFDESMVLMKRTLRWRMKDILYMKVNEMHLRPNSTWRTTPNLTTTEFLAFRYCNKLDYALYEHFLSIFFDKIDGEKNFRDEVDAYKEVLKLVKTFCSNRKLGKRLHIPGGEWTEEFFLSRCECDLMLKGEIGMVDIVRQKQLWLYRQNMLKDRSSNPKPTQPITSKLSKPVIPKPTQSAVSIPLQSANQKPSQPANQKPSQPANQKPSQPANQKPSQPTNQKPSQPANQKPSQRVTSKPSQRVTSKPSQPITTKPSQPITTKPSQPITTKPSQPVTPKVS